MADETETVADLRHEIELLHVTIDALNRTNAELRADADRLVDQRLLALKTVERLQSPHSLLVTVHDIAEAYETTVDAVRKWTRQDWFPERSANEYDSRCWRASQVTAAVRLKQNRKLRIPWSEAIGELNTQAE